jgi:tetratricopeptide (TPR) repeat protein
METPSYREEQMEPGSHEKRKIEEMCLEAVELTLSVGPERAMEALENLAHTYPHHSAPRVSLAKLYRWMALRESPGGPFEGGKLRTAVEHAKLAVALEDPPELATLELVSDMLHMLGAHEERASFLSSLAGRHPDPAISLKAFSWASVALQCRGLELEAEGKHEQANSAYRDSVTMHRRALQAWPEAPVTEKLSSYFGESHTIQAYSLSGLADEWAREVEQLLASEEGLALPGDVCGNYFSHAGEMAVEAGLCQKGVVLAEKALRAKEGGETACRYRLGIMSMLGALLIAYHAAGDGSARESVAERIEGMLRQWEDGAEEDKTLLPESRLPAGYNLAARAFIMIRDWERAIRASRRGSELWDFGPNHWFLAVSLWAGRRDREGALGALRDAARDTRLSGRSDCRGLRDDFKRSSHFSDVQEDKDFLAAIEVAELGG